MYPMCGATMKCQMTALVTHVKCYVALRLIGIGRRF